MKKNDTDVTITLPESITVDTSKLTSQSYTVGNYNNIIWGDSTISNKTILVTDSTWSTIYPRRDADQVIPAMYKMITASQVVGAELNGDVLKSYCDWLEKHINEDITEESFKVFYKEYHNKQFDQKIQDVLEGVE